MILRIFDDFGRLKAIVDFWHKKKSPSTGRRLYARVYNKERERARYTRD